MARSNGNEDPLGSDPPRQWGSSSLRRKLPPRGDGMEHEMCTNGYADHNATIDIL
jgi:hypothetical protein